MNISNKHGIYELPNDLKTQDLWKLENIRKMSKLHTIIPSFLKQQTIFCNFDFRKKGLDASHFRFTLKKISKLFTIKFLFLSMSYTQLWEMHIFVTLSVSMSRRKRNLMNRGLPLIKSFSNKNLSFCILNGSSSVFKYV